MAHKKGLGSTKNGRDSRAQRLGVKAGQMFQPIRVAVCGRKAAPPLFETLEVLGRETCLHRIDRAIHLLESRNEAVSHVDS